MLPWGDCRSVDGHAATRVWDEIMRGWVSKPELVRNGLSSGKTVFGTRLARRSGVCDGESWRKRSRDYKEEGEKGRGKERKEKGRREGRVESVVLEIGRTGGFFFFYWSN